MVVDPTRALHGTIQGHVARANPHHGLVRAAAEREGGPRESLVVFTGPDAYVTPAWYPGEAVHGREVPTWNYVAVHAYGPLALREDPAWLMAHLARLTDPSEAGRPAPWAVSDAPADFMAQQLQGIVGFELAIGRLEGRWRMNQNRSHVDIAGIVAGLAASERPADRGARGAATAAADIAPFPERQPGAGNRPRPTAGPEGGGSDAAVCLRGR